MVESVGVGVAVPEIQHDADAADRFAALIHDLSAHDPPWLEPEVLRPGFRIQLDVTLLGGVTLGFNCQDIFAEFDGLESELTLSIRLHCWIAVLLSDRSVSQCRRADGKWGCFPGPQFGRVLQPIVGRISVGA